MTLMEYLPQLKWVDDSASSKLDSKSFQRTLVILENNFISVIQSITTITYSVLLSEVTIYEQFVFCLNTILGDIAARHLTLRDRIIDHQLSLLEELVEDVDEFINGPVSSPSPSPAVSPAISPNSSGTKIKPTRRLNSEGNHTYFFFS